MPHTGLPWSVPRDLDKARGASAYVPGFTIEPLDLASLASVRGAADRLTASDPFDLIIAMPA